MKYSAYFNLSIILASNLKSYFLIELVISFEIYKNKFE